MLTIGKLSEATGVKVPTIRYYEKIGILPEADRSAGNQRLYGRMALDRLTFVACDLESDAGWDAAMAGINAVLHTASPFPTTSPKDEMLLIRPARDGTLRVLRAAHRAGITRVILTSSVVAVVHRYQTPP